MSMTLIALLLVASPAGDQGPEPAEKKVIYIKNNSVEVEAGEQKQVVCKAVGAPVGTRLGKRRVCKTKAEWANERTQIREGIDKFQTRTPWQGGGD